MYFCGCVVNVSDECKGVVAASHLTSFASRACFLPSHLSHGGHLHVLLVVVAVHLRLDVEHGAELIHVSLAAGGGQDAVISEGVQLRHLRQELAK